LRGRNRRKRRINPLGWLLLIITATSGFDFSAGRDLAELQQDAAKAGGGRKLGQNEFKASLISAPFHANG
jgi:hypothetical protein